MFWYFFFGWPSFNLFVGRIAFSIAVHLTIFLYDNRRSLLMLWSNAENASSSSPIKSTQISRTTSHLDGCILQKIFHLILEMMIPNTGLTVLSQRNTHTLLYYAPFCWIPPLWKKWAISDLIILFRSSRTGRKSVHGVLTSVMHVYVGGLKNVLYNDSFLIHITSILFSVLYYS